MRREMGRVASQYKKVKEEAGIDNQKDEQEQTPSLI
jgi:hypothetical protein